MRASGQVVVVFLVFIALTRQALGDYTVTSGVSDFEARVVLGPSGPTGDYDPGGSVNTTSLRIGTSGGVNNRVYGNALMFFKLPVLQPGETITGANFRVMEFADPVHGNVTINADLWALGYVNDPVPLNNAAESQRYFFNGPVDANPGVGTGAIRSLIQDNFLVPADVIDTGGAPEPHDTNAAGDVSLLGYIQSLYANSNVIPGTTSVILRLNYDDATFAPVFATPVNHYTIGSGENSTGGLSPTLTLTTTVPEPASLAIACLGAVALLIRRRAARH
jgi:hypothetical protein